MVKQYFNRPRSSDEGSRNSICSGKSVLEFIDNREAAITQRRLQKFADNSQQTMKLGLIQDKVNSSATGIDSALCNTSNNPIQMLHQEDDSVWSDNDKFAVALSGSKNFLACDNSNLPSFSNMAWQKSGTISYDIDNDSDNSMDVNVELDKWRPKMDDKMLKVPKDCLLTAELVSAWISDNDPNNTLQVEYPVTVNEANKNITAGIGDILFHTHSSQNGDFHAAAIVAKDAGDVVTMEGDASDGEKTASMTPLFDMYAGHSGFHSDQDEGKVQEKTYVISLGKGRGGKSLTKSLDDVEFTEAGKNAANAIIKAINKKDDK